MERLLLVGLEDDEQEKIRAAVDMPVIAHVGLPRIIVDDGVLYVERRQGPGFLPVSHVVFHGIYEDDLDFISALALWGGPCLPHAAAMMDCRLKIPCLIRALRYTRFGSSSRGYASPGAYFTSDGERVAKWGNWHCGENKVRFSGSWSSENPCIIERFLPGQSVRIAIIGDRYWQIALEGDDWRKSLHDAKATLMEVDQELLVDTQAVQKGLGLEIIANDYILGDDGSKHLLEANHIPNITRFSELWEAYREYVTTWLRNASTD